MNGHLSDILLDHDGVVARCGTPVEARPSSAHRQEEARSMFPRESSSHETEFSSSTMVANVSGSVSLPSVLSLSGAAAELMDGRVGTRTFCDQPWNTMRFAATMEPCCTGREVTKKPQRVS